MGGILRNISARALEVQMRNVDPAETCLTGRKDFTVVPYSVTKNGVPSNKRFRFQDNAVKVSRIWEGMYCVFALIFPVVPEKATMTVVQMKPTLGAGDHVVACVTHLQPTQRYARERSWQGESKHWLSQPSLGILLMASTNSPRTPWIHLLGLGFWTTEIHPTAFDLWIFSILRQSIISAALIHNNYDTHGTKLNHIKIHITALLVVQFAP
jgi:hypothetical protein